MAAGKTEGPPLQHGSPSLASRFLPSGFLARRAKFDDLEAGEGPGCQVTRPSVPSLEHAPPPTNARAWQAGGSS